MLETNFDGSEFDWDSHSEAPGWTLCRLKREIQLKRARANGIHSSEHECHGYPSNSCGDTSGKHCLCGHACKSVGQQGSHHSVHMYPSWSSHNNSISKAMPLSNVNWQKTVCAYWELNLRSLSSSHSPKSAIFSITPPLVIIIQIQALKLTPLISP